MSLGTDIPHILVVDDDERLRTLLAKFLRDKGFMVTTASRASDAREKMKSLAFDLIILDLMMPGETGLEFATDLRTRDSIPILMLTAMAEIEDRIAGLEIGADDYLVKPFEPRELLLRIHNIFKRVPEKVTLADEIVMGDVIYRPARGELERDGQPIRLTDIESALLGALAERAGQILDRDVLIELTGAAGGGRAVDVQVTRIRRKIEDNPKLPRYLQTVRGKGYVLYPD